MSLNGIESLQGQTLVPSLPKIDAPRMGDTQSIGSFGQEFKAALDKISQVQHEARSQVRAFELGVPGVALNDVMVDLQKSSVSLQMGVQVRNRLVSAYQEIMNMSV